MVTDDSGIAAMATVIAASRVASESRARNAFHSRTPTLLACRAGGRRRRYRESDGAEPRQQRGRADKELDPGGHLFRGGKKPKNTAR